MFELSKCLHESIVPFLSTGDYVILATKLEEGAAEFETEQQAKQTEFFYLKLFLIYAHRIRVS